MEITETTRLADVLETETCTRCGGSGHYSWNSKDGTRCYKCGGQGSHLSKRGAAALDYWKFLFSCEARYVQIGDRILETYPTTRWRKVIGIEREGETHIRFQIGETQFTTPFVGDAVRVGERDFKLTGLKAIAAYQDSLTKAGKPRKRPAA